MIRKFVTVFFIFLFCVLIVRSVSAVQAPGGGGNDLTNPIEDVLKNIPGKKPPIVGVTCGQALESPTDKASDVNLCCVAPKQFDVEKNAINVLSNFMCLPEIASVPTRIVGGILGAINPINKVKGFGELFSGHILDGLGDITGLKSIFGTAQTVTDPLCIGDIASGLANRITQQKSFVTFQENISSAGVNPCQEGAIPSINKSTKVCTCVQQTTISLSILCANYVKDPNQAKACQACALKNGVYSGVGCIGTNASGFVATLMTFGVGLAGIAAFLCIIYAAFILQTSRGNPERIKKAREYLTNCIIGLLIIIFAVFVLRLIGVDILQIAGLV